jgi:HlyD family secretion protein
MSTAKKLALAVLVLVTLGGSGAAGWIYLSGPAGSKGPITVYGNVEHRESDLAFPVSGRVAEYHVREGARVAAGDLIASLEAERYRQAVKEAQAKLRARRQELAKLEAGSRPQEIRRAEAQVRAAEAELDNAKQRLDRLEGLSERSYASEQALDEARTARRAARARLDAARESLALAREGPREETVAAAQQQVAAAAARYRRQREDLKDTRLHAPAAGILRHRLMEPGETATPRTPVATLALRDAVWVRAYLPQPQLGRVQPGMAAAITSDSFPGRTFAAVVGHIAPTAEFTPKSVQTTDVRPDLVYRVRIRVCGRGEDLRLGQPVTVRIRPDSGTTGCPEG